MSAMTHVTFREELWGVGSLDLQCEAQGLSLGCQARQPLPLHAEPPLSQKCAVVAFQLSFIRAAGFSDFLPLLGQLH